MKLYAITAKSSGTLLRYEGTQAEAKAAARDLDANWAQTGVPTDKPSLIAHLNTLCGRTDGKQVAAEPAPTPVTAPTVPAPTVYVEPTKREIAFQAKLQIDDYIARAVYDEARRVQSLANERMLEHLVDMRKARS